MNSQVHAKNMLTTVNIVGMRLVTGHWLEGRLEGTLDGCQAHGLRTSGG